MDVYLEGLEDDDGATILPSAARDDGDGGAAIATAISAAAAAGETLSNEVIRKNIQDVFLAGFDTTASIISAMLFEVSA